MVYGTVRVYPAGYPLRFQLVRAHLEKQLILYINFPLCKTDGISSRQSEAKVQRGNGEFAN